MRTNRLHCLCCRVQAHICMRCLNTARFLNPTARDPAGLYQRPTAVNAVSRIPCSTSSSMACAFSEAVYGQNTLGLNIGAFPACVRLFCTLWPLLPCAHNTPPPNGHRSAPGTLLLIAAIPWARMCLAPACAARYPDSGSWAAGLKFRFCPSCPFSRTGRAHL